MKPHGKGRWDSLYFDYPVFTAPPREGLATSAPVTIVGAGPIGMIAALTLAHHGQPSVIVDDKHTFNDGSRAICVARSSLVAMQMLGIEAPFLGKALAWHSGRSFFRGKQILEFFMGDSDEERHRPMYNLEQQYIEKFLHDAVAASPLIDMRWQTACTGVADLPEGAGDGEDNGAGVMLTLNDPDGPYEMRTDWLLAADGARSPIRAMKGLRLKGQNFEGRYVIADIKMTNPVPVERFALFDPDARPGSTVLVHQQPDDIWRIDYQLRDDEDEDEALREANIRAAVQRVLDECGYSAPWELEWWSVYSANTLLLDSYRHGRTIFIGDSAHIVPIFGVRGFNNGVLDGVNIGWKLAWHLAGKADEALLDSYDHERRRATLDVIEKSGKSAQFMTPRTRGFTIMRDAALSLALDFPFASQFANPRNMTPYEYRDSPLTLAGANANANACANANASAGADTGDQADSWDGATGAAHPGAAAPDARMQTGFLMDLFGPGFTLLVFGTSRALTEPDAGKAIEADDQITMIHLAADSGAARVYGAADGDAVLIRPDRFIAARWHDAKAAEIIAAVDSICAGGRLEDNRSMA